MAIVKTDDQYYTLIANTIRERTGIDILYRPLELADAIYSIFCNVVNKSEVYVYHPSGSTITIASNNVDNSGITINQINDAQTNVSGLIPSEWEISCQCNGFAVDTPLNIEVNNQQVTYYVYFTQQMFCHQLRVRAPAGCEISINGQVWFSLGSTVTNINTICLADNTAATYNIVASGYGSSKSGTVVVSSSMTVPQIYEIDLLYSIQNYVTVRIYVPNWVQHSYIYCDTTYDGHVKHYATEISSDMSGYRQWVIYNFPRLYSEDRHTFRVGTEGGQLYFNVIANFYNGTNEFVCVVF